MIQILWLIYRLSILIFTPPTEGGVASQYGEPGDIYAQQALACDISKHIDNYVHICASRWVPCGTVLLLQNQSNHELSWCTVMDRGPYGAMIKNDDNTYSWGMKITPRDPGVWRGILDMSPATTKEMHHNGFEHIKYWIIRSKYISRLINYI
jgi:hypothetical protein